MNRCLYLIHDTFDELGEACIKCVYGCILRPHVLQGLSGTHTGWVDLQPARTYWLYPVALTR